MNIRKLINRLPDSILNARLVCWLFPQFNQTWNDQPQTLAKLARATARPGWTARPDTPRLAGCQSSTRQNTALR